MKDSIIKIRDLLIAGFCKGTMARDADNNSVSVSSPRACKFCLVGAVIRVDTTMEHYIKLKLRAKTNYDYLTVFNDMTSQDTVICFLNAVIAEL